MGEREIARGITEHIARRLQETAPRPGELNFGWPNRVDFFHPYDVRLTPDSDRMADI